MSNGGKHSCWLLLSGVGELEWVKPGGGGAKITTCTFDETSGRGRGRVDASEEKASCRVCVLARVCLHRVRERVREKKRNGSVVLFLHEMFTVDTADESVVHLL